MMQHGEQQFQEIRKALVGEDLGKIGGIVKDIADIKNQLTTVTNQISSQAKSKRLSHRENVLILVALISVIGSIITALISVLAR
jgi:hypothetical protein